MTKPLLVLDADAIMHRAYHALPPVAGAAGRPVNALVGFTNMLIGFWHRYEPRAIAVGLDSRQPGYRNALWPAYQAQRPPFDAEIVSQLDDLPDYLGAFGVVVGRIDTYEADDAIATYATRETAAGGRSVVLTSDRDAFQLVDAAVSVARPMTGGREPELVDPDGVVERYGVLPIQVPDLIALRGDPSDNIPGARGIGQKTAAALLRRHGTLEEVIAARPDLDADMLHLFRDVATMRRDLRIDVPPTSTPKWRAGAEAARRRGMPRLAERLVELADASPS